MPLIKAQCSNCGGILEVDSIKGSAICPFCNTPYIVDRSSSENVDAEINTAITLLEKEDFRGAHNAFEDLTKRFPTNYKAWIGLAIMDGGLKGHPNKTCVIKSMEYAPMDIKDALGDFIICPPIYMSNLQKDSLRLESEIKTLNEELSEAELHSNIPVKTGFASLFTDKKKLEDERNRANAKVVAIKKELNEKENLLKSTNNIISELKTKGKPLSFYIDLLKH